jgi:hypothetical protein
MEVKVSHYPDFWMASGPESSKDGHPPSRPKAGSLAATNLRLQPLSDQGRGFAIDAAVQLFRRHRLAIRPRVSVPPSVFSTACLDRVEGVGGDAECDI